MSQRSVSLPHLAWAGGHVLVLLGTLYTLTGLVTFSPRNKSYYVSYAGALLSWGIVVYKSFGTPQLSTAYLRRAVIDENVQYLILALYWFLHKPIYVTLIPFATFSLFHTLTFIRSTVLPKPPPKPTAAAKAAKTPQPPPTASTKLSKMIQAWVRAHFEQAMTFVAYFEIIVVFGRIFLGAIVFRNSFLMPIFFAHFLRVRVYISPPTNKAFKSVAHTLSTETSKPGRPGALKKAFDVVQTLVLRYVETVLALPPLEGQGAPTAAAGAAPAAGGAGAQAGAR